ncbi:MAG: glycosyltransferase, partial [Candidatus Margulisbacteria bacterium]|nr:glycosyltransferase [Candidatus Margulisiibacteriota bacterium]
TALRAKALSIVGLSYYYSLHPNKTKIKNLIHELADDLLNNFEDVSQPNWQWFERYLSYSHGRLPHALLMAYAVTQNPKYLEVAEKSLKFLADLLIINSELVVAGDKEWYEQDGVRSFYSQLPIDASCLVEAFVLAHQITQNKDYYNHAQNCFKWFFGKNSTKESLYDQNTGGCFNGLPIKGTNGKQSAEATTAYILAYLAFLELKEKIFIPGFEVKK